MGFGVGALYGRFVWAILFDTNRNGELNWPFSGAGAGTAELKSKLESKAGSGAETLWAAPSMQISKAPSRVRTDASRLM